MVTIKLTTSSNRPNDPLFLRHSPSMSSQWNDTKFNVNTNEKKCDWWVIMHNSALKVTETAFCDPNHVVYVSLEPNESVGNVAQQFLNQFSLILSTDTEINHPNLLNLNLQPWHIGQTIHFKNQKHIFSTDNYLTYDDLILDINEKKKNKISAIISKKSFLPGHKKRLNFIETLMASKIAPHIDLYGAGFQHIDDKFDAIKNYKYHLAIENDFKANYWTEKLTDAFIGEALPLYYGCPNISDYLPANSLIPIDIAKPISAIKILETTLKNHQYTKSLEAIRTTKSIVMNKYNIFNQLSSLFQEPAKIHRKIELKPNYYFTDPLGRSTLKKIYYNTLSLRKKLTEKL